MCLPIGYQGRRPRTPVTGVGSLTDVDIRQASNSPGSAEEQPRAPDAPVVLQVLPSLETGGVERGTVDVAAATVAAGWSSVVASAGGRLVYELQRSGVRHRTLPLTRKTPWGIWRNVARLEQLIRDTGSHLVHARSRAPAWSARFAARRAGVPFVTTFHGTYNFNNRLKRRYNAVMTEGELVIAISRFIAGHLMEYYRVPERRIRVVPRGVDLGLFSPDSVQPERMVKLATRWQLPDGVPVILLPGRLTRWKGQLVLIDALAQLGERDFICLLVGSDQGRTGYRRELEARVGQHGLERKVFLRDDCDDMPAVYKLADVVVSASTDPEAFGRVAAEAQAMGRPLVASNHGGVPEQVVDGETAFLVRPNDPGDLARGLRTALDLDADQRARMAEAAIARARLFSKDEMCRKTLEVYEEVLRRR